MYRNYSTKIVQTAWYPKRNSFNCNKTIHKLKLPFRYTVKHLIAGIGRKFRLVTANRSGLVRSIKSGVHHSAKWFRTMQRVRFSNDGIQIFSRQISFSLLSNDALLFVQVTTAKIIFSLEEGKICKRIDREHSTFLKHFGIPALKKKNVKFSTISSQWRNSILRK